MAKKTASLHSSTAELLQLFGNRLRLARKRRRLTARAVAERAGMAPMTLRSLERGGSGVTIGAYLAVMQVLGIEHDIGQLAAADPIGRELQDAQLSASRKKRSNSVPAEESKSHRPRGAATRLQRSAPDRATEQAHERRDVLPDGDLHDAQQTPVAAQVHEAQEAPAAAPVQKAQKAVRKAQLRSAVDPAPPEQLLLFVEPPDDDEGPEASQPEAEKIGVARTDGGDPAGSG